MQVRIFVDEQKINVNFVVQVVFQDIWRDLNAGYCFEFSEAFFYLLSSENRH